MEITIEKFIEICKRVGLTEEVIIKMISHLFFEKDPKNTALPVENNYTWGNHDQRPDGDCPTCGASLSGNASAPKWPRCPYCNQLLDWGK